MYNETTCYRIHKYDDIKSGMKRIKIGHGFGFNFAYIPLGITHIESTISNRFNYNKAVYLPNSIIYIKFSIYAHINSDKLPSNLQYIEYSSRYNNNLPIFLNAISTLTYYTNNFEYTSLPCGIKMCNIDIPKYVILDIGLNLNQNIYNKITHLSLKCPIKNMNYIENMSSITHLAIHDYAYEILSYVNKLKNLTVLYLSNIEMLYAYIQHINKCEKLNSIYIGDYDNKNEYIDFKYKMISNDFKPLLECTKLKNIIIINPNNKSVLYEYYDIINKLINSNDKKCNVLYVIDKTKYGKSLYTSYTSTFKL